MKKYFLIIYVFIFLLFSCENDKILEIPNTENLQEAYDHLKAEQIFNHINILVENNFSNEDCVLITRILLTAVSRKQL